MRRIRRIISKYLKRRRFAALQRKYEHFTMIEREFYVANLLLADRFRGVQGAVVECGVWRGGMIAGLSELFGPQRKYYLFDSFEGLPEAKEIDGPAAIDWQKDTESPAYFENCKAEIQFANDATALSPATNFVFEKGFFESTVPGYEIPEGISLLRLDGDWYDSTMCCLDHFYPQVTDGGLVIIDDYMAWDGCAKAVHDYLSKTGSADRIREFTGVSYIVKTSGRTRRPLEGRPPSSVEASSDGSVVPAARSPKNEKP